MPIKVFDLAKEVKRSNSEMVSWLDSNGYGKLAPSSDLDDATAEKIRRALDPSVNTAPAVSGDAVEVPVNATVKELGERLGVGAAAVQKVLMDFGVLAGLNQRLAPDAVTRIAKKLGKTVRSAAAPAPATEAPVAVAPTRPADVATSPATAPVAVGVKPAAPSRSAQARTAIAAGARASDFVARPPIVTIMGHVDHGKTTLLDTIRKAKVAAGEAGGITQHIGAYQVEQDGKRITFIDTPGHAAFSSMRRRGANVTDIVVLVVAADDSVMPQTEEAIKITKEAGVPMIVAVNKIDLPDANPERVLTDLASRYDVIPEAYGGEVPTVNISAKTGENLSALFESILLVSEIVVDPKADPAGKVQGTVIEAKVDKGRGAVVTVLVQQGTLRTGDIVTAGIHYGKVRGMIDDRGNKVQKAGPSTPIEIVGFGSVPDAGDKLEVVKDEKEARNVTGNRDTLQREDRLVSNNKTTLEQLYQVLRTGPVKELNVVIKGDVQGSVQAIQDSIRDLGNDEVRVRILSGGVGPVSESDVLLVSSDRDADVKNSLILAFNVGLAGGVDKKAEKEHVTIKSFSVIYHLIDEVKLAMLALLPPIYEEANLGKAQIRQLFKLPGGRQIAGSYVTDGILKRNARVRVFRGKDMLHDGEIDTLKRFKDDQREVASGFECGLTVRDFNEIQVDDILECYELRQVQREL